MPAGTKAGGSALAQHGKAFTFKSNGSGAGFAGSGRAGLHSRHAKKPERSRHESFAIRQRLSLPSQGLPVARPSRTHEESAGVGIRAAAPPALCAGSNYGGRLVCCAVCGADQSPRLRNFSLPDRRPDGPLSLPDPYRLGRYRSGRVQAGLISKAEALAFGPV